MVGEEEMEAHAAMLQSQIDSIAEEFEEEPSRPQPRQQQTLPQVDSGDFPELWCLRQERDGEMFYSSPMSRMRFEEFVKKNHLEGTVCFCVTMPSHKTRVRVEMAWEESSLIASE